MAWPGAAEQRVQWFRVAVDDINFALVRRDFLLWKALRFWGWCGERILPPLPVLGMWFIWRLCQELSHVRALDE